MILNKIHNKYLNNNIKILANVRILFPIILKNTDNFFYYKILKCILKQKIYINK